LRVKSKLLPDVATQARVDQVERLEILNSQSISPEISSEKDNLIVSAL
jgi:AMMECR1 domain-containing protein